MTGAIFDRVVLDRDGFERGDFDPADRVRLAALNVDLRIDRGQYVAVMGRCALQRIADAGYPAPRQSTS